MDWYEIGPTRAILPPKYYGPHQVQTLDFMKIYTHLLKELGLIELMLIKPTWTVNPAEEVSDEVIVGPGRS